MVDGESRPLGKTRRVDDDCLSDVVKLLSIEVEKLE